MRSYVSQFLEMNGGRVCKLQMLLLIKFREEEKQCLDPYM